jgi:hypothetical protein
LFNLRPEFCNSFINRCFYAVVFNVCSNARPFNRRVCLYLSNVNGAIGGSFYSLNT